MADCWPLSQAGSHRSCNNARARTWYSIRVPGTIEKGKTLAQLSADSRIQPHEMCAIGDDLPDGPMLHRCGLSAAPADASPPLASTVNWLTQKPGGQGAVRELIEMIMQAQVPGKRFVISI